MSIDNSIITAEAKMKMPDGAPTTGRGRKSAHGLTCFFARGKPRSALLAGASTIALAALGCPGRRPAFRRPRPSRSSTIPDRSRPTAATSPSTPAQASPAVRRRLRQQLRDRRAQQQRRDLWRVPRHGADSRRDRVAGKLRSDDRFSDQLAGATIAGGSADAARLSTPRGPRAARACRTPARSRP